MAQQKSPIQEIRSMTLPDLQREVQERTLLIAKIRMGIHMQKEKDTAKLRRERRALARMKTVLVERLAKAA